MRQKKIEKKTEKQRTSTKEPLAETIQKKRREHRKWISMTDEDLISFAKKFIEENEINNRSNLAKADSGLGRILRIRNLLDAVIPEKRRDWASISNEELTTFAKKFIEKNRIKSRSGLQKAELGLYHVLRKRNLLDAVIPGKQNRDWASMSDNGLIHLARNFTEENKIKNRKGLEKADISLYDILGKRNLLDVVIPEKRKVRNWSSLPNEELIQFSKKFIEKNRINNRNGLTEADQGLYDVLRRRNLLDAVIPKKRETRDPRDWSSMTDDELIQFTKNFTEENAIKSRKGLEKADRGLYYVLRKRNLLCAVIPEKQRRDWFSMSDTELISFAKNFMNRNGIKKRKSLEKADLGFYQALMRRNLLDAVFSPIEQAKKTAAVKQVVDAMKEFGGSE